MTYAREEEVAVEAVREAAELCWVVRQQMVTGQALEKADRSPVTVADFGSQAVICRRLADAFPGDAIVAEEDAGELRKPGNAHLLAQVHGYANRCCPEATRDEVCGWIDVGNGAVSSRYWALDPIDGTKGFLRNDQYAVALALVEAGKVVVAVLACPELPLCLDRPGDGGGTLFVAVRGEGATAVPAAGGVPRSIAVAAEPSPSSRRFVESVESSHGDHDLQLTLARRVGIGAPSLRVDSQAKYGIVARGDAVLYLRLPSRERPDYGLRIWDHAAGSLVVEEAGGRVTDVFGRALDFSEGPAMERNTGVVASNGEIHSAVIGALSELVSTDPE